MIGYQSSSLHLIIHTRFNDITEQQIISTRPHKSHASLHTSTWSTHASWASSTGSSHKVVWGLHSESWFSIFWDTSNVQYERPSIYCQSSYQILQSSVMGMYITGLVQEQMKLHCKCTGVTPHWHQPFDMHHQERVKSWRPSDANMHQWIS